MRAVQIVKPNELKLIDTEKPAIAEKDNVFVKMTVVGVCGPDMGIYHGTSAIVVHPRITSHETVGRVEETGSGVANLKVGDRAIINRVTGCGHYYSCKVGRGSVCGSLVVRGVYIDDGYREYTVIPESDCHVLPESLSDQGTVTIEPTTIGIQPYTRANPEEDDLLLIYGSGALGSSVLKIAHLLRDHIVVADVVDDELEAIKANGATHTVNVLKENLIEKVKEYTYGYGAAVSIDVVCNKDSLINLLQATSDAGCVATIGFSITPIEINQLLVTSKELDVRGSRLQNKMFGKVIELVNEDKLDFTNPISYTFPPARAQEAFDFVDSHNPSIHKIVLASDF